jgi:hypothetical protein
MEKELAHPRRIGGVFTPPLLIGADVHVVDIDFAILDPAEGLLETDLAQPLRLDFGAGQNQPGLKDIVDKIVVIRLLVAGDEFDAHRSIVRTKGFKRDKDGKL